DPYAMDRYLDVSEDAHGSGSFLYQWRGPLGAVVATCTLLDVVPIVGGDDVYRDRNGCRTGKRGFVFVRSDRERLERYRWTGRQYEQVLTEDTTAQIPYGDFAPGRWAWLLADVRALPEPVPAKGHRRLWTWTEAA
ncbi:MAG: hypothetical protein ACLGIO_02995, partial [Acidimicrobiia bacterium]